MKTMSWIGAKGNKIELRASCTTKVVDNIVNSDGYEINVGKATRTDARLELWVDDKLIETCSDINFWRIIDAGKGLKKIWGLRVGMDAARAAEVEAFLQEVIESGKEAEVVEKDQEEAKAAEDAKVKEAERIVAKAATQGRIMTNAEYRAWRQEYNAIHNEGKNGYVPEMITVEQLEAAKKLLAKEEEK